MNQTVLAIAAIFGGLALIILVVLGAVATYDAIADNGDNVMADMWEMMGDMGGMMDDGMGDMMEGIMGDGGPETTGSASGRGEVSVADFRFDPTVFTVTVGTIVEWTNEDTAPHTATAQDGSFDTGRLDQADSGAVTFDSPGTFDCYCVYHPWMEAQVVVTGAAP